MSEYQTHEAARIALLAVRELPRIEGALREALEQPDQAAEPVFAFRRKGLDDFCTCTKKRYKELSLKPDLFETRIFYTTLQPARQPLTSAQIDEIADQHRSQLNGQPYFAWYDYARAIERAHGIGGEA